MSTIDFAAQRRAIWGERKFTPEEVEQLDRVEDKPLNCLEQSFCDALLLEESNLIAEEQDAIRRRMRKGESARAYERINGVAR